MMWDIPMESWIEKKTTHEEWTFLHTGKLLEKMMIETLAQWGPWYPLVHKKQIEEMQKDHSGKLYMIQVDYKTNKQSSVHQQMLGAVTANPSSWITYYTLSMDDKGAWWLLKKIGSEQKEPCVLVIMNGTIVQTITQPLNGTGWTKMVDAIKKNNSSAQEEIKRYYTYAGPVITMDVQTQTPLDIDVKTKIPWIIDFDVKTEEQSVNTIPTTQDTTQQQNTTQNEVKEVQPWLTLDPIVRVQWSSETYNAYFEPWAQDFVMIIGNGWVRRDISLLGDWAVLKQLWGKKSGAIQLWTKTYMLTWVNADNKITFSLKLTKDSTITLPTHVPANPMNVSGRGLYLQWSNERFPITTIDKRLYTSNGTIYPPSRELTFDEASGVLCLNGVDEWRLAFDKRLLYINPMWLKPNVVYKWKDAKFGLPIAYKLIPCQNGVLRVEVNPAPETVKAYADQWYKWPKVSRPFESKTSKEFPGLPDIGDVFEDITRIFEGDPNENVDSDESGIGDFSYEDFPEGTKMVDGTKMRGVYTTVYWVPEDMVGDVKAEYNDATGKVLIYVDWWINKKIALLDVSELKRGGNDHVLRWRRFQKLHEWTISATIDGSWRLRVMRWEKTWPWYESAESPLWWTLPVDLPPGPKCHLSSWWWWLRDNGRRLHRALDFYMPEWSTVKTVASGTVTYAGRLWWYGNIVIIDHGNWYVTKYAHLKSCGVSLGQKVTQGQKIGLSGHTWSYIWPTWDHLHFEVRKNGKYVHGESIIDVTPYDIGSKKHARNIKPWTGKKSWKKHWSWENEMYRTGQVLEWKWTYYNKGNPYTASWEAFDKNALRAAHNGLPFGTKVRVTNTANGKSVDLIINDTWWFTEAEIDLTEWASKQINDGVAATLDVKIEVLQLWDGQYRQWETPKVQWSTKSGGNNAPNTTPNKPNAPTASPEIALMKEPPAYIATSLTFWWKQYAAYASVITWNPGASTKTAPRGWLVEVKNGNITVHTQDWIKTVAAKWTFESGWKTYTLQANVDNANKAYPNAARFSIVTK